MAGNKKKTRKYTKPRKESERYRQADRTAERSERGSRPAENDISWYSRYPNLLIAAGSFPYPYRPGMTLPMGSRSFTYNGKSFEGTVGHKIPGVMSLEWLPSLGVSNTATDPASVMAKEIYAKVRKAYAGALNADAPDFVMYLLALDGVFSYIAALKRIYRLLTAWSPDNYQLPDTVLAAVGVNQQEAVALRTDKTKLWQCINTLVLQSRKFTCPAVMDYFNRHYWMNDNVYTDAASINSQMYVFRMEGVFKFAELNMPNGDPAGGLEMTPTPWNMYMRSSQNILTVDVLYNFGLSLIEALVAWDEAYEINGYLSRAFEGAPQFIVDELPIDQPFNPVYSEEVLTQIENSRCAPAASRITWMNAKAFEGFNITQDVLTNAVICNPSYTVMDDFEWEVQGQGYLTPPWLSARTDAPTVANNVIASRLQCVAKSVTNKLVKLQCASEIPLVWRIYNYGNGGLGMQSIAQTPVIVTQSDYDGSTTTTTDNGVAKRVSWIIDLGQFDWHPFIVATTAAIASNSGVVASTTWNAQIAGDIHNITMITEADLENLHRVCLYSELNSFSVN